MKKYDDIVVGSGISGLTMSLLLARNGRSVLLLEKGPHIGGSLSRFTKKGISFDTGFHFTGGLQEGGILHNILTLLGIRDRIQPVFYNDEHAASFIFEDLGRTFDHPAGIPNIKKRFNEYFPGEASAIERYFDLAASVCARTPSMNFQMNMVAPPMLDEDFITLDEALRNLTESKALRAMISGYTMLYGVKPNEVSFANHARMCQSFYESVATVEHGGDGFVNAFKAAFQDVPVEVRTRTYLAELAQVVDGKVGRFVLNTGEELSAENCIFTIHPGEIAKLLPREHVSKAFLNRVASFEPSVGFFSVFATLRDGAEDPYPDQAIVSLFPTNDVNELLDPAYEGEPALVIIKAGDAPGGKKSIHVLAPSFLRNVEQWSDTRIGKRPPEYYAFKEHMTQGIMEHIFRELPGYQGKIEVVDSASVLTFRDYLNSPDGSAYGIKQKIGQFNVVGRLPLKNLYAAGQSAVLPGIIGSMMSSFIVGRNMMGKDRYGAFVNQGLCS